LKKMLEHILSEVSDAVRDNISIKKVCEGLSGINPIDFV